MYRDDKPQIPDAPSSAREALCALLREQGILRAGADQAIRDRDGTPAAWMFYSWGASMTTRGAELAGRCLLEKLRDFESTQLASCGYTGLPLLSACVLLGRGRYTGLAVRAERKKHGSCRQVEGPIDRSRPVVLIDDSLSSGTSMRAAIAALEGAGLRVEGCVCLVHFPWRGGAEWARALGYRVETVFDIWDDLAMPIPAYVPGFQRVPVSWAPEHEALENGLPPATAARRAAEFFLARGEAPLPPARLDAAYDARGGVFVSFRDRDTDRRLARDGFWHFDPADASVCRDLVLATVKTVRAYREALEAHGLDRLKIAVSFFGPLERIAPDQLDFSRYGIVVRSRVYAKTGGALPNTQIFTSEAEQYFHARVRNAALSPVEPHDLFRHEIVKSVEPGERWLPYGTREAPAAWKQDPRVGAALAKRARAALRASPEKPPEAPYPPIMGGSENEEAALSCPVPPLLGAEGAFPLADDLIPDPISAVAVTLFDQGRPVGSQVAWGDTLDACVVRAAAGAFSAAAPSTDPAVLISVLHDREWLGETTPENAAAKLRPGLDALCAEQGDRRALALPFTACHNDWTREQTARALLGDAGITEGPSSWATFRTTSWLDWRGETRLLAFGFPERPGLTMPAAIALIAGYVRNHQGPDGLPDYGYLPTRDRAVRIGTAARVLHGLAALEEAGRFLGREEFRAAARRGFDHCRERLIPGKDGYPVLTLPDLIGGPVAESVLLAGLAGCGEPALRDDAVRALAQKTRALIQPDGALSTLPFGRRIGADQDFLPGIALFALARYAAASGDHAVLEALPACLDWYRRRFRLVHPWGMAGWHPQCWTAAHALSSDPATAEFVFEIADWALDWQVETTGAFVTDIEPQGPGFNTGFILEGIAAAWELAERLGDRERARRYAASWERGVCFLDSLVIRPEDTFCMPCPPRACGGVRGSRQSSAVRIDFVSHLLTALVRGARNQSREERQ